MTILQLVSEDEILVPVSSMVKVPTIEWSQVFLLDYKATGKTEARILLNHSLCTSIRRQSSLPFYYQGSLKDRDRILLCFISNHLRHIFLFFLSFNGRAETLKSGGLLRF